MQFPLRPARVPNAPASPLRGPSNRSATLFGMSKANLAIGVMNDDDLLACTRELVRNSCDIEAELLLHLAEIDERKTRRASLGRRSSLRPACARSPFHGREPAAPPGGRDR